jgi:hypothetical protein
VLNAELEIIRVGEHGPLDAAYQLVKFCEQFHLNYCCFTKYFMKI